MIKAVNLISPFSGIKLLKSCLEGFVEVLELHPQFLKNTAYIARFIKLFRCQFKASPILQFMRKIKLAIEKIHINNAQDVTTSILSGFPIHLGTGYDLELPSRQYYEFCLAKILAHAQIMLRLVDCSKRCTMYFIHYLQYGHFMEISTMSIALLGHIWQQARQSLLQLDKCFRELTKFRDLFPINTKNSQPEVVIELPANVIELIGATQWEKNIDVAEDEIPTIFASSKTAFKSVTKMETNTTSEETLAAPATKPSVHKLSVKEEENSDIGEVISRDTLKPTGHPEILGKRSLFTFLKTENELRAKNSSKSLTKGVPQFHWEKFRRSLEIQIKRPGDVNIKEFFDKSFTELLKTHGK